MLLRAASELNIDLENSYMIGDKQSDIEAGKAAGCESFLVSTGHSQNSQMTLPDVVKTILS